MNDMAQTIIPKSDQLNADDLLAGPRTITIREVNINPGTEQPVAVFFVGDDGKPFLPCKSMRRVMVAIWGPDANVYTGRSMTLFRDPSVTWGGMEVGGIRISHMSHLDQKTAVVLTASKKTRKPFVVLPLVKPVEPVNTAPPSDKLRRTFSSVLADVKKLLADAKTVEAIDEVMGSDDAAKLTTNEKAAAELNTAVQEARKRVTVVPAGAIDDEIPF